MTDTQINVLSRTQRIIVNPNNSLNLVGPKQVIQIVNAGPQGPQGFLGPQGVPGPIGFSAYEIAVLEGFVGTEVEWLTTLEGPQGPPGPISEAPQAYRHVQTSPASTWFVQHDLGYRPSVSEIKDSGGTLWTGTPVHVDDNSLTLSFFVAGQPVAFSGEASFS